MTIWRAKLTDLLISSPNAIPRERVVVIAVEVLLTCWPILQRQVACASGNDKIKLGRFAHEMRVAMHLGDSGFRLLFPVPF